MTIGEFKAWLAGYLESCSATPVKRVKRIEEKLAEVCEPSTIVPHPVYLDRYIYPQPWTSPYITWTSGTNPELSSTSWTVSNDQICSGNTTVAYLNTEGD